LRRRGGRRRRGLFVALRYACLRAVDPTQEPEPWEPDPRKRMVLNAIDEAEKPRRLQAAVDYEW
jgi:hypothetical protein